MRKKILLIDDEREILHILSEVLHDEGFDVAVATNGWRALDMLVEFKPDLILCDVMMPVISGLDLLERFRTLPGFKETPFILMSAVPLKGDSAEMHGATFIRKPFDLDTVVELIQGQLCART